MKSLNKKLDSKLQREPISKMTEPPSGLCRVIKDHWWAVTEDEKILFYNGRKGAKFSSPQCNADERCARRLHEKLYPGLEVRQIPVVFVPDDPRNYM